MVNIADRLFLEFSVTMLQELLKLSFGPPMLRDSEQNR